MKQRTMVDRILWLGSWQRTLMLRDFAQSATVDRQTEKALERKGNEEETDWERKRIYDG